MGINQAKYPHCDAQVLHAPGKCEYCDMYPEAQQDRISTNVNFTGESNPAKKQCPAELQRSLQIINKWYGNVAHPIKELKCTCGHASVNSNRHENYCDLYEHIND